MERATNIRTPASSTGRAPRTPFPSWEGAIVFLAVAILFVGFPLPAAAQSSSGSEGSSGSLEAAEAAADSGRVERARELLDAWLAAREGSAPSGRVDRARFLEARLAADPDSARRLYARLAVEAGSEVGGRARLRLAQLRLAGGQTAAALGDLELVRADHPGSPAAAESWLWTGRAHRAGGDSAAACRAYGRAERSAARAGLADLRRRAEEARAGCTGSAGAGDVARGAAPEPRWVVQLGAFSDDAAAERLRGRAEEAGFQTRVVTGGEQGLHRVRVGRFADRAAAEAVVRRLEERGFRALVVDAGGSADAGADGSGDTAAGGSGP